MSYLVSRRHTVEAIPGRGAWRAWGVEACSPGDHRGYRGDGRHLARLFNADAGAERDMWLLTKRVPLMIRLPEGRHREAVDVVGGVLDIAPTILSLLGVEGRPDSCWAAT